MAKGIFVGSAPIKNIYVGGAPAKNVYLGNTRVWPGWNPTDIIRGKLGAYYEFGVGLTSLGIHRCYQNTARTTPCTAAGQIVKSVSDLSGNGRHLTTGTNPTLEQDTAGYYLKRESGQTGNAFNGTVSDTVVNGAFLAICAGVSGDTAVGASTIIASYHQFITSSLLQFNSMASTNIGINGQGVGPSGVPNLSFDASTGNNDKIRLLYRILWQTPNTNFYCHRNGSLTVLSGSNNGYAGQAPAPHTKFEIGHSSHKLRAALYGGNIAFANADWTLLDDYWNNVLTGAQAI